MAIEPATAVSTMSRTQSRHQVVVVRVVRDVPRAIAFSRPPIRCSRPAFPGPPTAGRASARRAGTAGTRLRSWLRRERNRDVRQGRDVRQEPRLRSVRQVGVREQVHGRSVLQRDATRLDRRFEAVRRRHRSHHRNRRLRVTAEQHHQQVALLRLRRHPRRRACALDVADHERQLQLHRQADRLLLQHDSRPADVVTPSAPPNDAPRAAPTAAISSSAWNVRTPKCL